MTVAQITARKDTTANWAAANPILAAGEPGFDTTLKRLKIGDGVSSWSALSWATMGTDEVAAVLAASESINAGLDATDGAFAAVLADPESESAAALSATIASDIGAQAPGIITDVLASDPALVDAAAIAAAEKAQSDAGLVRSTPADRTAEDDGVMGMLTPTGRLAFALRSDGLASKGTAAKFAPYFQQARQAEKIPGVFAVFRTASGKGPIAVLDDGSLDSVPSQGTIDRIALALGGGLGESWVGPTITEAIGADTFVTDGTTGRREKVVPVDRSKLGWIGSSTWSHIINNPALISAFAASVGATITNMCGSGSIIEHQLAKFGSHPLRTSAPFTVPVSGTVLVVSDNCTSNLAFAWSMDGHFPGYETIPGTLATSSIAEAAWTFSPSVHPGSPVTIPAGTPFIPNAGANARRGVLIANLGVNNMRTGGLPAGTGTTDPDVIVAYIKEAFRYAEATAKPMLLVDYFNTTDASDAEIAKKAKVAREVKAFVGSARWAAISDYVGGHGIYDSLGLTPSTADLVQIARGCKGPQISAYTSGAYPSGTLDPVHLNGAAEAAMFNDCLIPALNASGWYL